MHGWRLGLLVACIFAAPVVASADTYTYKFNVAAGYVRPGQGFIPLPGIRIEVWEVDNIGGDWHVGTMTSGTGNYTFGPYNIGDTNAEPDVVLIAKYFNNSFTLGHVEGNTLVPNQQRYDDNEYPIEFPSHPDFPYEYYCHNDWCEFPVQWDLSVVDEDETSHRSANVWHTLYDAFQRVPQATCNVLFHKFVGTTRWNAEAGWLEVAWADYANEPRILEALGRSLLARYGDLNDVATPPGATFTSVSTEQYAWDAGAAAFLGAALGGQSIGTWCDLECDVVAPASSNDAMATPASVAAALWDLYDSAGGVEDGAGPGFDDYNGTLGAISYVLTGGSPVQTRTISQFWSRWKGIGLPGHFPVLALRHNGVDFNTPPVWTPIQPTWLNPGTTYAYNLGLNVADVESLDNQMIYTVTGNGYGRFDRPMPISITVVGSMAYVTITSDEPDGYGFAFLSATANDGLAVRGLDHFKVIWTWDPKGGDDPPQLDRATGTDRLTPEKFALRGDGTLSTGGRFELALPARGDVDVSVLDLQGRHVRTLTEGERPAGRHVLEWNGTSDAGVRVVPGVYFLTARFGDQRATVRTSVVR